MPTMTVDLRDVEDLQQALAIIETRLRELGDDAGAGGPTESHDSDTESDPLYVEDPARFARRLLVRIKTNNTREMVRAFVELDDPFTLEQVAERLGVEPQVVRARKFRFGRTENKLKEEFGAPLLAQEWNNEAWRNYYRMNPRVRAALREILVGGPAQNDSEKLIAF